MQAARFRLRASGLVTVVTLAGTLCAAALAQNQNQRAVWNEPQRPFTVFGNVYWVGTRALGSVLITSTQGHILIDGALPESVPQIAANVTAVGYDIKDVKLLVNSHVHYDHSGGLAQLQRLSGARVAASASSAKVLMSGASGPDDPQFGILPAIDAIPKVDVVKDGETLTVGPLSVTAHVTPGHTPGGTSWSWRSCEGARCLNVVYADSLSPVSADGFKYTASPLLRAFERSYATLETLPCDILLTPHPDFAQVLQKLAAREAGTPGAFVDPGACRTYAASARKNLATRVAMERGH